MEIFMLKREINRFVLTLDGAPDYSLEAPFTLYSVLCDLDRIDGRSADHGKSNIKKMCLEASFFVDGALKDRGYTYFRISGIEGVCHVFVNGKSVGVTDGVRHTELIDISEAAEAGQNILRLEFENPDWDCGIFSPIELLQFEGAVIDKVSAIQEGDGDALSLRVSLSVVGNSESCRAVATLISGSGHIYYGGFIDGEAVIHVREPLLWWPNGLGVQNVYKLTVNLYGDTEIEDTREFKVGLRSIKPTEDGSSVTLLINGASFLPMGAVYVPEKRYLPTEAPRRAAAFITSAAMSGFNSFVIRGGKLPPDSFFDLCDVHGISVIYEPEKIGERELCDIRRVSSHPSFVAVDVLPGVKDGAPLGELSEAARGTLLTFPEERAEYFGEISIPCDKTTYAAITPDGRNVLSQEMEEHSGGRCSELVSSVAKRYLYPWTASDFAYLTRLSQAESCKGEMLSRRLAFGKEGRAVFSNISSDSLISESSIDQNARWKALQYYARSFFAPTVISAEISGTEVSFFASNNLKTALFGTLEYKIIDRENKTLYKGFEEIEISESSSAKICTRDFAEQVAGFEGERVLEYSLVEGGVTVSRATALFVLPKRFNYKAPNIKAEISGGDRRFSVTLSAEAYAGCVELSFTEADAVFADNYFDITAEVPVKINFSVNSSEETVKSLKKQLKIKSLYDIGRT